MAINLPWHLYLMAAFYFLAGANHFRNPLLYLKIIPPYFPNPKFLNYFVGFIEMLFGIGLCIPAYSKAAAWAIIALLVIIFPANLFMYMNKTAGLGLPKTLLLFRLPLQIVLMIWAYYYTL